MPDAGGVALADAVEEGVHGVETRLIADRGIDHRGERAGAGRAHQRPGGDQVGEVECRDAMLLGMLHHRRRADRELRRKAVDGGDVLFQ